MQGLQDHVNILMVYDKAQFGLSSQNSQSFFLKENIGVHKETLCYLVVE